MTRPWPWDRLGLRMRLALLYGGLFFVAGSMLLCVTYLLTARAMNTQFVTKFGGPLIAGSEDVPPDAGSPVRQVRVDVEQGAATVLSDMLRSSVVIMIVIGIIAFVLGYLVADRALRPLDRVTETARRLSESTLHERIGLRG
ncbi:two-component sensor histidine kinase, partial [Nonomuraea sp. NPDC052129]